MKNDISEVDVLNVFKMYIGLKLHFTSQNYVYKDDFGHKTLNPHSMNKRKDINMFIEVADRFYNKSEDLKSNMVSMFKKNPDSWIGTLTDKSFSNIHKDRLSFIYNLEYNIKKDIESINDIIEHKNIPLSELIKCDGDRPYIIKKMKLSDEFLALLDFSHPYLMQDTENPLWKKRSFILHKYKHVIENVGENILSLFDDLN